MSEFGSREVVDRTPDERGTRNAQRGAKYATFHVPRWVVPAPFPALHTPRSSFRAPCWRCLLTLLCFLSASATPCRAALDELPVERWARLREAERYQLDIAEKYYREQNWKVALAEYEKFLSLYETSEGAAYAQLKWGLCQTNLRKLNTAIKDGYQSILDYWPDSP